ncbi:MAG: WD40 repeat domain-containing protein [Planctomycetia bacterium]|nr:WD40 repeat domain-containing protein [Planctomycetia bacterium]
MVRPFRLACLLILSASLLPATHAPLSVAQAGKVKVWHHQAPTHHDKAQFKNVVVSNEGVLRLARELKPFAAVKSTHIWDVVEDKDGHLYVAGGEGKVWKVAPDGKVAVVYSGQESQVFCLALAPDNAILAGTGPNGQIVRIAPDGTHKVLCETNESYVWSLAVDSRGEFIYAGTGPKGRIHRLTPQGKSSVFYSTKQEHILSVACGPDGNVYAGTDKNGLVYRIDGQGKGFVLCQTPQTEVRSLLVTPAGVYAGTSAPVKRRALGGSATVERPGPGNAVLPSSSASRTAEPVGVEESDKGSAASSKDKEKEPEKGTPAPAAPPPTTGENSVFFIRSDGTVREIFRDKVMVLSLLQTNGRLLVGTGMDGRLFEVNETTKEKTEIARLDHGQIQCLCQRRDGSIVLGAGDPGKLFVLQDRHAASGTVTSDVLDAKIVSKWGALRWKAETPNGCKVTVAVRTGNVAEPDETWSDWSAEQTDAEQAVIAAPAARFLQYRLTLASANPALSPSVGSVTLRYSTTNQAPEVTGLEVPDLDAVNLDNPKKLKIKWTAQDANEDELTYHLFIRKEGWKNWVQLEDNLTKTEYEWDTTTTPAGVYQVKVSASDRRDNPDGEALVGERISTSVAVAHVPPTVTLKVVGIEGDQAVVEATASDPLVRLTGASFAVNGKRWINVFPTDGLFDSKTETFKFKTDALRPGTHVLVLRVKDAAGNVGSGDAVFTVQPRAAK